MDRPTRAFGPAFRSCAVLVAALGLASCSAPSSERRPAISRGAVVGPRSTASDGATLDQSDGGDGATADAGTPMDGGSRRLNGQPTTAAVERRVAAMLLEVSRVRGLAARASLRSAVLSRTGLISVVRDHVDGELPRDVIRDQGEFMVALGLVPAGFDYEAGVFGLLESELAGFYEPRDKTMYMAADLSGAAAEATLAHELVHALQDQHYDLGPNLRYAPDANDRLSALQALAEGDATSAMIDVLGRQTGRQAIDLPDGVFAASVEASLAGSDLSSVPRILRASLAAPYVDGVLFVNHLRRSGGWRAVDRVWKSPPETTEQLLHPAKYEARERAEDVPMPTAPREGKWQAAYHDVFGEEGLRIVLEEWLSKREAALASEGWGGDRGVLFRSSDACDGGAGRGQSVALAWRIRFDATPEPEADGGARRIFHLLGKVFHASSSSTAFCAARPGFGTLGAARAKRDIAIVVGPYEHRGATIAPQASCEQVVAWARENVDDAAREAMRKAGSTPGRL